MGYTGWYKTENMWIAEDDTYKAEIIRYTKGYYGWYAYKKPSYIIESGYAKTAKNAKAEAFASVIQDMKYRENIEPSS